MLHRDFYRHGSLRRAVLARRPRWKCARRSAPPQAGEQAIARVARVAQGVRRRIVRNGLNTGHTVLAASWAEVVFLLEPGLIPSLVPGIPCLE